MQCVAPAVTTLLDTRRPALDALTEEPPKNKHFTEILSYAAKKSLGACPYGPLAPPLCHKLRATLRVPTHQQEHPEVPATPRRLEYGENFVHCPTQEASLPIIAGLTGATPNWSALRARAPRNDEQLAANRRRERAWLSMLDGVFARAGGHQWMRARNRWCYRAC